MKEYHRRSVSLRVSKGSGLHSYPNPENALACASAISFAMSDGSKLLHKPGCPFQKCRFVLVDLSLSIVHASMTWEGL